MIIAFCQPERITEEAAVAYFEVTECRLDGPRKTKRETCQDSRYPDRNSKSVPHEYKSETLPTSSITKQA
jgi:hypothetical protein